MKFLKHVYTSVQHFHASTEKPWIVLLLESLYLWFLCLTKLMAIKSYRYKRHTDQYSVYTLLSHFDIPFYIIAIWSLYRFLLNNPRLIILDDGTLTRGDCRMLAKLPRATIMKYTQTNLRATKIFGEHDILLAQRLYSPYNRKLIDPLLWKISCKKILLLDSDVLFFQNPTVLIDFLSTNTPSVDMVYIQDMKSAYIAPMSVLNRVFATACVSRLNSGTLGLCTDILTQSFISDYYRMLRSHFYNKPLFAPWVEQTGYAILAAKVKAQPLPCEYIVGNTPDKTTICKHYVHGHRPAYMKDILALTFLRSII